MRAACEWIKPQLPEKVKRNLTSPRRAVSRPNRMQGSGVEPKRRPRTTRKTPAHRKKFGPARVIAQISNLVTTTRRFRQGRARHSVRAARGTDSSLRRARSDAPYHRCKARKVCGGARAAYVFSVAAAILAAVEGGILPPGKNARFFRDPQSAGRLEELCRRAGCPGSTAGETPAATTKHIPRGPKVSEAVPGLDRRVKAVLLKWTRFHDWWSA